MKVLVFAHALKVGGIANDYAAPSARRAGLVLLCAAGARFLADLLDHRQGMALFGDNEMGVFDTAAKAADVLSVPSSRGRARLNRFAGAPQHHRRCRPHRYRRKLIKGWYNARNAEATSSAGSCRYQGTQRLSEVTERPEFAL